MKTILFEEIIKLPNLKDQWEKVIAFVECHGLEKLHLWSKYEKQIQWKEQSVCPWPTLGYLDDRPIKICFQFETLNNFSVCFWEPTSQVVDYLLIEDFLKYVQNKFHTKALMIDAQNFHLVIQKITNDF